MKDSVMDAKIAGCTGKKDNVDCEKRSTCKRYHIFRYGTRPCFHVCPLRKGQSCFEYEPLDEVRSEALA